MRTLIVASALAFSTAATAQATGVNFTIMYGHSLYSHQPGFSPNTTYGFGVQHDLSDRLGFGVDVNYVSTGYSSTDAWEFMYHAKYFASDNDATAFYIGSFIGVQNASGDYPFVTLPIGLRTGVRGGLEGYYAELFLQAGYSIGSGELVRYPEGGVLESKPLFFGIGVSFLGFGWD